MQNFRQSLPPLDHLIAFEAAARHGSFTKAAHELNITQSAVSQQIRTLEDRMGVSLFERSHKVVRLTAEGRTFQNSVSVALGHLLSAANTVRGTTSAGGKRLHVATDDSIAALWLTPRLHKFQALFPEITLRLTSSDRIEECFADPVELAIVHGDGGWPGYECELFIEEEIFPVCAPTYLEKSGPIHTATDLAGADLVDLDYERWNWMNWAIWLTENGVALASERRKFQCNSYPLVMEAARNGQGVALGWRQFVDDDLLAGRLTRPINTSLKTHFAYYLVRRYNRPESPQARAFRSWLISERDSQPLHAP
ncbi:MAG: LysR family transcriptional regulator [Alphaproteobacteria bacterium]|nr:LysR family transcriptional regulator [Alphaproteobacteria bacterium]